MLSFVLFGFIALGFLAAPGSAQVDCTGLPDGSYGYGCLSYTKCENGRGTIINCPIPGFAYDWRTGECEPAVTVPPPCGSIDNNCTGHADGRYAILPECTYYYTCNNQIFFGANPCNNQNQNDLRYDEDEDVCNWVWAVRPPCGTAPPRSRPQPKEQHEPQLANMRRFRNP